MPVLLVAGAVHHLDGIDCLGEVRRAHWSTLVAEAAREGAGLALVGRPASGDDARALIRAVRRDRHSRQLPLLHLAPQLPCVGCEADVCLPADARSETLRDVCRILLDLGRSRRRTASLDRGQVPVPEAAPHSEGPGQLAADIAHDFNNALNVISGQALLAQNQLPAGHPARRRLDRIVGASQRAAGLTRQLLAFGRAPQSQPLPLDFNELVATIARLLGRAIGAGIEVETRLDRTIGFVLADRAQVEQVLLDLALNALDAMPRGGNLLFETADVDEAPPSAEEPAPRPGPHVRLRVSGGGPGLDVETRAHVFERFATSRRQDGGAGLRLANVRRILGECGGVVGLDGERGAGGATVYLPRVVGLAVGTGAAPGDSAPEPTGTVLLVEDEDLARAATGEMLEGLGYTVLAARHGLQALAAARSHAGPIHLLLTDLVLPGIDGASLARELVTLRPEIRVIFTTGHGPALETTRRAVATGAQLLPKPFDVARLAEAVRRELEGAPAASHPRAAAS